jgi:hypothetical protein
LRSLATSFLIAFVLVAIAGAASFPQNQVLVPLVSLMLLLIVLTSISMLVAYSAFGPTKRYRAFSIGALMPILLIMFGNETIQSAFRFSANGNTPVGVPVALIQLMAITFACAASGTFSMIAWLCFFESPDVDTSQHSPPADGAQSSLKEVNDHRT